MKHMIRQLPTLFLLMIFAGTTPSFGQTGTARQRAIRLLEEGDAFLQMRNWEEALHSYTNAIQADNTFAQAYMKRGQLYEKTTHHQEAMADYDMAIKLNPYIDIYFDQRARVRILSFDYYGAMDDINKAIQLNPDNEQYLKQRVDNYIAMGLYENALAEIDSVYEEDQDQLYFLQRKALVYLLNDDLANADKTAQEAFFLNDSAYVTLDLLGLIELKKERYQEAIDWFDRAIEVNPEGFAAWYNKGISLRFLGEKDAALEAISKALDINSNIQEAYFKRALIRKEQGDLEGAVDDYSEAIEINPDYEKAIYNRAFTYKLLGNYMEAEDDLNDLKDGLDAEPEFWNLRGNIQVLQGDFSQAIRYYDKAISFDMEYAEAFYNRGIAKLLLNQHEMACEDFEYSINLNYDRAELIYDSFCGF